jgi:hypothetical protein
MQTSVESYPRAAVERAMTVKEVILQAMARKLTRFSMSLVVVLAGSCLQRGRSRSCFLQCGRHSLLLREIGRHFCGMGRLLFSLRVSWVSLAGCGAGEEEVAFAGVAGKGGGAFELGAGFRIAA